MSAGPGPSAIQGREIQPALGRGLHLRFNPTRLVVRGRREEAGIRPSGSQGDIHDNPLAETITDLYTAEVKYRRFWPTRESVKLATHE